MIRRQTIQNIKAQVLVWKGNTLTNPENVIYSSANEEISNVNSYGYSYPFDSCIVSDDLKYVFIYQRLGVKGVLLKEGTILREINRPFYHATTYEYPAVFITYQDKTYLVHCPHSYCQLDFEDVETGEIVTNIPERKPADFFQSRLEVSRDGKYLMSKGWVWHPLDYISVYNIQDCFADPLLLDKFSYMKPDANAEINIGGFINGETALLGCFGDSELFDDEVPDILTYRQIGIWNFKENSLRKVQKTEAELGNIYVIDENYAWDLYKYPKIIDIHTGEVKEEIKDIDSGLQNSSIIHHVKNLPTIAISRDRRNIAIKRENTIDILSYTE